MNFIVIVSSFIITFRLLKINNLLDALIGWFIVYFSQIIFTELLLGLSGILYLHNLILINSVILAIVWLISKNNETVFSLPDGKSKICALFSNKAVLFCATLILAFVLVKVSINLVNPPFGWDSLNYHFTFPVEWLKSAKFNTPIVVSDDPFPAYYPINGSLIFLWYILPFKSAFLADLAQLSFFIISFLCVFSISNKIGLNKVYAFFAASLFVIIPNHFKQLEIGYVDIMVGGIFLTVLNFLLTLRKSFRLKNIILFSLSFGIFIGIKSTCLAYSLWLLFLFIYVIFSAKLQRLKKKSLFIALFLILILIFGGYGYFKNYILTANPFYPLKLKIFGKIILKGVVDKATFTARNTKDGYSFVKLLFHEGLGIQSLLIILPGTVAAACLNIFKDKNKSFFLNYILFLPVLLYLTYRFLLPIPNTRYLYPMLGVGIISGFYLFNAFSLPAKIIQGLSIACLLASVIECARHFELIISLILSAVLFALFIFISKYEKLRRFLFSKSMILIFIICFLVIFKYSFNNYRNNEYSRYVKNSRYWPDAAKAWLWLNQNTQGANIAYVGRPVPYPLYGTDFKNNVYYASVNNINPIHLHDLKNSNYQWDNNALNMHKSFEKPNNYRGNASYNAWLNNLKNRKTDLLFIYSLHHVDDVLFPIEEQWAKNHPDKFIPVFSNETIRIYKLDI